MEIRAAEISAIIKEQIESFGTESEIAEVVIEGRGDIECDGQHRRRETSIHVRFDGEFSRIHVIPDGQRVIGRHAAAPIVEGDDCA